MKGFEIFDLIITDVNKKSKTEELSRCDSQKFEPKQMRLVFRGCLKTFV